jgi:hypothetical protein
LATALSLQPPSPICHPERSRGTCGAPFRGLVCAGQSVFKCSSAEFSWKCFSTGRLVVCGSFAAGRGLVFPELLRR